MRETDTWKVREHLLLSVQRHHYILFSLQRQFEKKYKPKNATSLVDRSNLKRFLIASLVKKFQFCTPEKIVGGAVYARIKELHIANIPLSVFD